MSRTQVCTQNQIKNQQNNNPKNLISTNLIKCTHCNSYIPLNELDGHTIMHFPLAATHGYNKPLKLGKMDIGYVISGKQNEAQLEIIQVRSFLPDDFPKIEKTKKVCQNAQKGLKLANLGHSKLNLLDGHLQTIRRTPDALQEVSQLSKEYAEKQSENQLNFYRPIQLNERTIKVQQAKNIAFYTSQQPLSSGWHTDKVQIPNKIKAQQETDLLEEDSEQYLVSPVKIPIQSIQNVPIRVNIKLKVKNKEASLLGSNGMDLLTIKTNCDDLTDISNQQSKLECQNCHGFHCNRCGSDIPPIYRPINSNKQNQSIKSFYESRVYGKSSQKITRMTGCTNCE